MSHRRPKEFWNHQFDTVSDWLAGKGYMVALDTDVEDQVHIEEHIVQIDSRQHAESRFYTLLHEIIHGMITRKDGSELSEHIEHKLMELLDDQLI